LHGLVLPLLYETVGTPWLLYQRRQMVDAALAAELAKPTTEIFVHYVGGLPAGYFELDAAPPPGDRAGYFGLIPNSSGAGSRPFLCGRRSTEPGRVRSAAYGCTPAASTNPKALGTISAPGLVVTTARSCVSKTRASAASCRVR